MAAGGWGKEQVAHAAKAVRLFCQHLSLYSPWALPIENDEGLQAIAFAWLPADTNVAGQWLRERFPLITEEQRRTLLTNEGYLMRTDKERQKMILPDSAKHSFFISCKPGYGTPPVLESLFERSRQRGVACLYRWTDCTCNWQYYPKQEIGGNEQIFSLFLNADSKGDGYSPKTVLKKSTVCATTTLRLRVIVWFSPPPR